MRHRSVTAIGVLAILALTGCSAMRERRWGMCAVGGGLLGAAAGAAIAVPVAEGSSADFTDSEIVGMGVGSAAGGALLGTILGHLICDPREATPPPPPPPPPPAPAPRKITLSADTHFDFDKAVLKPEGERRVDEVVRAMKEDPKLTALVEGHTDSIGSDAYNMRLSERRAHSVKVYMVSQGIAADRITTRGYGESQPVSDNKTREGRAQNRRVEITIK